MPQRYRAVVRRFLWIGSRLRDCVAFGVAQQAARRGGFAMNIAKLPDLLRQKS
jgi:hypothetical protein